MTNLIPDSWELPSYTAGDIYDLDAHRALKNFERGGPRPEHQGDPGRVLPFHRDEWEDPEPSAWTESAKALRDIEPYNPDKHGSMEPGDLTSVDSLQALEREGFEPHEPGVWHRRVTHDEGSPLPMHHILTYEPGNRRPTSNERAPWILTTDPDTVGVAFRHLDGPGGALDAANQDRAQIRRMSRLGSFLHAIIHTAAKDRRTPAQIAADKWLEENSDQFDTWHPSESDYTYSDFGDAAGQSFHEGEEEGRGQVLPGSHYQFGHDGDWEDSSGGWSPTDDESGEPAEHERQLEELGFNWQNRGDPNTTPVGEYQEGEYVRHQHDPEGRHVATHTIRRVPYTNTWHVESTDPSDSNFAYESSDHRWPHDAISRYHDNAERALLPTRGYEPHRSSRTGAITHWTRTDTDPNSGQQYEHEINSQPSEGEGVGMGWLGHTVSEGMIAPSHGTRPLRSPDLADVVREHDRTGRGLHPGGSQDYRMTRDELLSDPSVARLGTPRYVSEGHFGDGKAGRALWVLEHPSTPHGVNAEATYNWDKGGYDFKYTHDGTWLAPTHNAVPEGAPVHVPGRQTRLPLEG